jgi:ABC-2 type transport system ATP-binding protein
LKVPGVVGIDALPSGLLRVAYAEGQMPAEALVQAAVSKGWGLYQINPDQTSLEEVFVQLTFQEQAA